MAFTEQATLTTCWDYELTLFCCHFQLGIYMVRPDSRILESRVRSTLISNMQERALDSNIQNAKGAVLDIYDQELLYLFEIVKE